jgi:hypothetical protein
MKKHITTNILRLRSLSSVSSSLGELATKTASRLEAVSAISQKCIVDREVSKELTKLGSAVLDAIKASKDSELLKGLLFGAGASVPIAAAGGYMVDRAGDRVEAMGNKALAAAPVAILAGLAAGKALSGSGKGTEKKSSYSTKDMLAAIALNAKLTSEDLNTKTASDREYLDKVVVRSNAHVADIVNSILN